MTRTFENDSHEQTQETSGTGEERLSVMSGGTSVWTRISHQHFTRSLYRFNLLPVCG